MQSPKQQHRPRNEMRALILELFALSNRALSRTEVSRSIGRQKAPHITILLEELVEEGLLEKSVRVYHNGARGYEYRLKP